MITSLAHRSIGRATSCRHFQTSLLTRPAAATQNLTTYFSTSPDYTNYETWHRDNYEDPTGSGPVNGSPVFLSNNDSLNVYFQRDNTARNDINSTAFHPEGPRTSVLMELSDGVGALHNVLRFL
mmetsp:Transcript_17904/g.32360  ORF Transcript_17904/g.32360 Transcript_17904/m.32360 type:complete len:124 (-) Transcript_17904:366-737(-)